MEYRTRHERSELAAQVLMERSPAAASLLLWAKHLDSPEGMTMTGTDGKSIYYSESFAKMPLGQQAFVMAHEVLHIALCHPTRGKRLQAREGQDYQPHIFNIAADALINEGLVNQKFFEVPKECVRIAALEEHVKKHGFKGSLSHENLDVETLYQILKKHSPKMKMQLIGQGTKADGTQSSGDLITPQGGDETREDQEMREWSRRFQRAMQGDRAGGILRGVTDLPKVRTPWEALLRTMVMQATSSTVEDTWMRPSRRYLANRGDIPYEPGTQAKPAPRIVVCIDTSGSIDESLFKRFIAEIVSIQNRTSSYAIVVVCDAEVHGVFDLGQDPAKVKKVEFKGGGGTSFIPAIEEAVKKNPAICVYLTDLMGSFPAKAPRFPVVWAVPGESKGLKAPFGRIIQLAD